VKKLLLTIIFIILSVGVYSINIVNIWADHDSSLLGVSRDRVWIKSYFLSNFEFYQTLDTEDSQGELTIVTINRKLYFRLVDLLKFTDQFETETFIISKKEDVYRLQDKVKNLDISFALEKPNDRILGIIDLVYLNDKKNRDIVKDHYLSTWVIRIHRAENITSPDDKSLDYSDVLISATIIGERFQQLWGVHDGVDYISTLLNSIEE
jgi:hypothetical protein